MNEHICVCVLEEVFNMSYPESSLSMTIFCRPVEMLQPASGGGEPESSEEGPGVIWTQDGLDRAELTSRRILGRGPSLEATLCEEGDTRQRKHNSGNLHYVNWMSFLSFLAEDDICIFFRLCYFPYAMHSTLLFRQHTE